MDNNREELKNITKIWEKLDSLNSIIEATARRILCKVRLPDSLSVLPEWADKEFASLNKVVEDEIPSIPIAIESAKNLILSCLATIENSDSLTAEIYTGPSGSVVVDWNVGNNRLQWIVGITELQWPGVLVTVLNRVGTYGNVKRSTYTFHDAFAVIDNFVNMLNEIGDYNEK